MAPLENLKHARAVMTPEPELEFPFGRRKSLCLCPSRFARRREGEFEISDVLDFHLVRALMSRRTAQPYMVLDLKVGNLARPHPELENPADGGFHLGAMRMVKCAERGLIAVLVGCRALLSEELAIAAHGVTLP